MDTSIALKSLNEIFAYVPDSCKAAMSVELNEVQQALFELEKLCTAEQERDQYKENCEFKNEIMQDWRKIMDDQQREIESLRAQLKAAQEQKPAFYMNGNSVLVSGRKYHELIMNTEQEQKFARGDFYAAPIPAQPSPEKLSDKQSNDQIIFDDEKMAVVPFTRLYQHLTDVMTACGLICSGHRDKGLSKRMSDQVNFIREAMFSNKQVETIPAQPSSAVAVPVDIQALIDNVRRLGIENTGNEPSVSCFHRALDELVNALIASPRITEQDAREMIKELADDLEAEINGRYGNDIHPAMKRKYDNDMDVVKRSRALLNKLNAQKAQQPEGQNQS